MPWEYKTLFFGAGQSAEIRRYGERTQVLQPYSPLPNHKIVTNHVLEIKLSPELKDFISKLEELVIMPFKEENAWFWAWEDISSGDVAELFGNAWHGEDRDVWHHNPGWERPIQNGGQLIDEEAP